MAVASYAISFMAAEINLGRSVIRSGNHPNPYELTIAAASSGTVTNRTNNTKTDVVLSAGHGLTNGTYDCFFSTGVAYACDWTTRRYTYMDESIRELTGYSPDEFTQDLFQSLVEEEISVLREGTTPEIRLCDTEPALRGVRRAEHRPSPARAVRWEPVNQRSHWGAARSDLLG